MFRGKGLEFEAFRDFTPDDDASYIDWKASSRAQKLLVKQYKEERDLKIFFLIDVGDNMVFGSGKKLKCEYSAELVAAFSRLMLDANDRVGFFLFSNKVKHFINPKSGEKHFQFLMDILTDVKTYGGFTNLDGALDYAMTYLPKSTSSVILISDFLSFTNETEKKINLLSHLVETVIIRVRDLLDITLPNVDSEIVVSNPSTDEQILLNPKVARGKYEEYALAQAKAVEDIFKKSEADYLDLITREPFSIPLATFLKERLKDNV